MRLWSLHPKYLDSKGLVALWREGLLAQNVLRGNTTGYKNHPQLVRFKECACPIRMIGTYMLHVHHESVERGYNFDINKIYERGMPLQQLTVTEAQLVFELSHLRNKLQKRDPGKLQTIELLTIAEPHPIFSVVPGRIADWERI